MPEHLVKSLHRPCRQCCRLRQRSFLAGHICLQTLDLFAAFAALLVIGNGGLLNAVLRFNGSITPSFDLVKI